MEKVNVSIKKIKNTGEDITTLVTEIKEIFDDTFLNIENMITRDNGWIGTTANNYLINLLAEKKHYNVFRKNLDSYAVFLKEYADLFYYLIPDLKDSIYYEPIKVQNLIMPYLNKTIKYLNDAIDMLSTIKNSTMDEININSALESICNIKNNLNDFNNKLVDSCSIIEKLENSAIDKSNKLPTELIPTRKNRIY